MAIVRANERNEDLARWIWTLVIVGFFAIQAVIWFVAITLTMSDPSFAVAPGYEQTAERWDALVAERESSRALGWTIELFAVAPETGGMPELRLRLVDRNGQPINDAQIELSLFHCARAAEVQEPEVRFLKSGLYAADAKLARSGFWKIRGTARRGDERFSFDQKQRVDVTGGLR